HSFFTRYELAEFAELKSKYAKNLYRLLKQFRHSGLLVKTTEDFRTLMDIPKSYQPINIDKRVIEPAMTELTPLFKDLTFTKRRAKRYNRITHYEFKFEPEPRTNEDFQAKDPEEVQKAFCGQEIPF
ncbi:MAG: replication initiation protein, partial [Gallicola sp.]|nr:replication initiation protein [Gallicola sp.]